MKIVIREGYNVPVPVFTIGDSVYLKESDNAHGTIIGMRCAPMRHGSQWWDYCFYMEHLGITNDWYNEDQLSFTPSSEEE